MIRRANRSSTSIRAAYHSRNPPTPLTRTTPRGVPAGRIYTCPMDPEVRQDRPGPCPKCGMALEPRAGGAGHEDRVDVPDAPGDRARRAGQSARSAAWRWSRGRHGARKRQNPELRRHDAPVLGRAWRSTAPAARWRWATCSRATRSARRSRRRRVTWLELAAGDARRALGRLAVLRAGVASVVNRQPQHVHAHRPRRGRRLRLQRRRDARCRDSSRPRSAAQAGEVGVYFEAAAVIIDAGPARQVLELRARSQTERRDPGAARPGAEDRAAHRRGRQRGGRAARAGAGRAIACACGPARRSRSTASSLEGASAVDESMVTGEPIPVEKQPGDRRRSAPRSTARERS